MVPRYEASTSVHELNSFYSLEDVGVEQPEPGVSDIGEAEAEAKRAQRKEKPL